MSNTNYITEQTALLGFTAVETALQLRVSHVDTIADLRATESVNLKFVLSHTNILWGGGGYFSTDGTTGHTSTEDDNGLNIVDGLGRLWVRQYDGLPTLRMFGASGVTNRIETDIIQNAIDSAPGTISVGNGIFEIDAPLLITRSGQGLVGENDSSSIIRGTFVGDLVHIAPLDLENDGILTGVNVEGLQLFQREPNPTSGSVILAHRARVRINKCSIFGGFSGISLVAVPQGCRVTQNVIIASVPYTQEVEGSSGISIRAGLSPSTSTLICNSVTISDNEIISHFSEPRRQHGLLIRGCDGLLLNSNYIGQHSISQVSIIKEFSSIAGMLGLSASDNYFDPGSVDGTGDYCVYSPDNASVSATCRHWNFSNNQYGGGQSSCMHLGPHVSEVSVSGGGFFLPEGAGISSEASNVVITGCNFRGANNGGGTSSTINIVDGDNVTISGNIINGGYRGVKTSPTFDGRLTLTGNQIYGQTEQPILFSHPYVKTDYVSNNSSDDVLSYAASLSLKIPVCVDVAHVTAGTSSIIRVDATESNGRDTYNNRRITLIFDDAILLRSSTAENIRLKDDVDFSATAGQSITLEYDPESEFYREISRLT